MHFASCLAHLVSPRSFRLSPHISPRLAHFAAITALHANTTSPQWPFAASSAPRAPVATYKPRHVTPRPHIPHVAPRPPAHSTHSACVIP
ncbi:hypothetical protein PLICRDRAFT_58346 [Plicaturopsis crispa FD-325 SS-3]|uniref:Uncharacterized protein n=1 Tax=Plicaturopsis crispa FD-325 SS-3 TaxID=944288 RepID=A0A0C9SWD6_PLICR|nr:hypothetical protein PLICRDRAFT_58346 [Plicaturopsis crispa FD-325 SS-3]